MDNILTEGSFYKELIKIIENGNVCVQESMSRHTTFRTGGSADYFIEIASVQELTEVLQLVHRENIDYYVVGNGSNLLVGDKGIRGAVLTLSGDMKNVSVTDERITAGAGVLLSQVSRQAQKYSLTGMEFASGIPGTIGGAVVMNAGAYGGEMSQVIEKVYAVTEDGERVVFTRDELELGYRSSIFKKRRMICTEVVLKLQKGDGALIQARMNELMQQRKEKQPIEYPSAGSTFKRPEGYFAGKLIMEAGLRGYQIGGARVSDKHCGFIVNVQQASSADIRALMDEVTKRVYDKDKVMLEPEVCMIGEF